jgi:hypothetical protein
MATLTELCSSGRNFHPDFLAILTPFIKILVGSIGMIGLGLNLGLIGHLLKRLALLLEL